MGAAEEAIRRSGRPGTWGPGGTCAACGLGHRTADHPRDDTHRPGTWESAGRAEGEHDATEFGARGRLLLEVDDACDVLAAAVAATRDITHLAGLTTGELGALRDRLARFAALLLGGTD